MGDTISESLRESWRDTKELLFMFMIIGGFVYIPVGFFLITMWVRSVFGDTAFILFMLPMMVAFMFTMSFWLNYFGEDDPAPPLMP